MQPMTEIELAEHEIQSGIQLAKCQQCGCMQETLDQIQAALPKLPADRVDRFQDQLPGWLAQMRSIQYACLGCDHCFAGAAQNAFTSAFPQVADTFGLSCEIIENHAGWPPVVGEYFILDPSAPVGLVTLGSTALAEDMAARNPAGLAIAGKLETENIGIDKLIKNTIANRNLRCLILAGVESAGHASGQTLLALAENGVDENGRVIGSRGKRPVLRNVSKEEIDTFRRQVQLVDLIGCVDADRVGFAIRQSAEHGEPVLEIASCSCGGT